MERIERKDLNKIPLEDMILWICSVNTIPVPESEIFSFLNEPIDDELIMSIPELKQTTMHDQSFVAFVTDEVKAESLKLLKEKYPDLSGPVMGKLWLKHIDLFDD